MVKLYDTYSSQQFVSYIAKLPAKVLGSQEIVSSEMTQLRDLSFVSVEMTQIPSLLLRTGWTNHQLILQRCTTIDQYIFYILYAEYEHLKNKELERAIKADTYSRMLSDKKWQSEMLKNTYPQTQLLLKDKAILEFLGLPKQYKESRLRKGIVEHMREFIVELGKDFLFVDEEHALEVGGKTYRCDLLFFHRALQCLVAIELKTTEFDPRDLGQLEFYLEALDQTERRSNENPSIGILMCKDANSEVVRYALNRSMSPTMVSMYEEHLKVGSVLQRSLEEFTNFLVK
jgi:predicted nuclease of restriction endonuclease-like (RecB) superfamily